MRPFEELIRSLKAVIEREVDHTRNYFELIKEVIASGEIEKCQKKEIISQLYKKVRLQILENNNEPATQVKFGTSGWRGVLGIDLHCRSVTQVTLAIIDMYRSLAVDSTLVEYLGVENLDSAKSQGCIIGFDNRFCGDILAVAAAKTLLDEGFVVHYAGESTTGVLSAAVLQLNAAFSINFTPSHNPLEYGGLKYNAADGGPAATELTTFITRRSNERIREGALLSNYSAAETVGEDVLGRVNCIDSFSLWQKHVRENFGCHDIAYNEVIDGFSAQKDCVLAIDSVHGASRIHMKTMFARSESSRLYHLRSEPDVTFGGVAPEPSSENMQGVVSCLLGRKEQYKLGAIIDPDGDRIRFTDGTMEISMNQFGAMAYHFLHRYKKKRGMIAKTVATSNLANNVAKGFGEEVFETKVGFKEFKPVIGKALVCFEESDGISIIGHTPEKDAYIGLLLAMDIVLTTKKNLSEYLKEIEDEFGYFYPHRDGIVVSQQGSELSAVLSQLSTYSVGTTIQVGSEEKTIAEVIDIDGWKMIFTDGSWLMIRPSGTEPKVRFYVESRTKEGTGDLVQAATDILKKINAV